MPDIRVESRYVKSLLGLAVEQHALEEVHKDMEMFTRIVKESRALQVMLKSPVIRHEKKKVILEKIFKGRVHPLTLAIMDILTRKNREPLLPSIALEFHNAYNEYKGISRASLTTSVPIDPALRAKFEEIVRKISTMKTVEIDEKIDKDLIGGFVLHVGDNRIDASIKSRLEKLKLLFSENPYVKAF